MSWAITGPGGDCNIAGGPGKDILYIKHLNIDNITWSPCVPCRVETNTTTERDMFAYMQTLDQTSKRTYEVS